MEKIIPHYASIVYCVQQKILNIHNKKIQNKK